MPEHQYDVAIVGGGPGGSTTGSILKKYNPGLKVVIFEREEFPRDHIGESQLPPIGRILTEMGVWPKIEAAGFPVKLGATYTWGKTTEPWVFSFIPVSEVREDPRPGKYEGWRTRVAMQVDRAKYDKILLEHAGELGCEVRQKTKVVKVHSEPSKAGPKVTALELENGEKITARYYVDASGNAAILRRQLGVEVDAPTLLRNVAFWDYWTKPGMNEPIKEFGGLRIHIRSLGYGWIWYIALSLDRTSVGVVCNAEYYKNSGKRPEEMLHESLAKQPQVSKWLEGATCRGKLDSTTDWSYVSEKVLGPNWFLCGECLGFADPILSAGLTLTHTCAEHLACTILELERGQIEPTWLRSQYESIQKRRVLQHMKFAEYWYSGNGLFQNILDNCAKIAEESGLPISPADAFRWLSNGGIDDHVGQFAIGGYGLSAVKSIQKRLSHKGDGEVRYFIDGATDLELNLSGANHSVIASPMGGTIRKVPVLERGNTRIPLSGPYGIAVDVLKKASKADAVLTGIKSAVAPLVTDAMSARALYAQVIQCIEALAAQGWITCRTRPGAPAIRLEAPDEGEIMYTQSKGPGGRGTA